MVNFYSFLHSLILFFFLPPPVSYLLLLPLLFFFFFFFLLQHFHHMALGSFSFSFFLFFFYPFTFSAPIFISGGGVVEDLKLSSPIWSRARPSLLANLKLCSPIWSSARPVAVADLCSSSSTALVADGCWGFWIWNLLEDPVFVAVVCGGGCSGADLSGSVFFFF